MVHCGYKRQNILVVHVKSNFFANVVLNILFGHPKRLTRVSILIKDTVCVDVGLVILA